MKASILPLRAVAQPLVYDFFARRGRSAEEVRWRYFDEAFNQGRERGYVWKTEDRVIGFIGIIPVGLATPAGDRELMWTCDWFVENAEQNPGMGVLLLKKVYSSYPVAANVGGTIFTRTIVPRLGTRVIDDAAVPFHLPLRAGVLLQKIERRLPLLKGISRSRRLSQFPVRFPIRVKRTDIAFVAGLHPQLERLFDQPTTTGCRVRQDLRFLQWHTRRPGVRAFSCWVGDAASPAAGALLWCSDSRPGFWYAAFRALPAAEAILAEAIGAVTSWVVEQGGLRLSSMASALDAARLESFQSRGFAEGPRQPLYIKVRDEPDTCPTGFANLSYLDSDLAMLA